MTGEEMTAWAARLSVKAARARSRSRSLQAETARMAREVSETEEAMAATLDRLASQHPGHAVRLQGMGEAAREHAALERQRLQQYLRGGGPETTGPANPRAAGPSPGPGRG